MLKAALTEVLDMQIISIPYFLLAQQKNSVLNVNFTANC